MRDEYIIVDLMKKDWSVKIEAEGFHGKVCVEALDAVQQIMGGKTLSEFKKPEFNEEETGERVRDKARA